MKRLQYKCTLLTDVILTANSATEGFRKSLDYIPGAKFLGIVANVIYPKEYPSGNLQACLDLFHNGKVSFGDAHPLLNGERLEKIPFSWEKPKSKKDGTQIYLGHKLSSKDRTKLPRLDKGPTGYLSTKNEHVNIEQNFSIKSAYAFAKDPDKEGQMYGYFALEKGTEWSFSIEMDEDYQSDTEAVLLGRHRVGRSKTAEYGMIEISTMELPIKSTLVDLKGSTLLYAASNWCFYDINGNSCARPDAHHLNIPFLKESDIDWVKSYIRTRTYRTWNQKRRNRDADRLIIEKGSVLVINLKETVSSDIFQKGIGSHRSEGFGRVIANPWFLQADEEIWPHPLKETKLLLQGNPYAVDVGAEDQQVLNYLAHWVKQREDKFSITKTVNNFLQEGKNIYSGISSSQWGQLRRLAKSCANEKALKKLLFDSEIGFCYRGKSENIWRKHNRRENLKKLLFEDSKIPEETILDLTIKLASEMAKASSVQSIN